VLCQFGNAWIGDPVLHVWLNRAEIIPYDLYESVRVQLMRRCTRVRRTVADGYASP
jgi:hypothetical protein